MQTLHFLLIGMFALLLVLPETDGKWGIGRALKRVGRNLEKAVKKVACKVNNNSSSVIIILQGK